MKPSPDDVGFAGDACVGLPMFAPWPERPAAAEVEQAVMPLRGTLEASYRAWRQTEDGVAVYAYVRHCTLLLAQNGARRIGVKALAEDARETLHRKINNSWTSMIARELRAAEPTLRGLIELREKTAA